MRYILMLFAILSFAIIFSKHEIHEKRPDHPPFEHKTEALDALRFLSAMQAYPHADIIPGSYAAAFEKYKLAFNNQASSRGGTDAWKCVGPDNVGGRTVSIAIHPVDTNIVWLGSASGGLWRSVTGGIGENAWQNIPTGFEVLGVGAIALNPDNPDEMFIGTGETYSYGTNSMGIANRLERGSYGIGILKSTDGGVTWEKSLDWTYNENRGVWEILYNPLNTNILYAATTEGVYKTEDGGATWEQVLDVKMVMDMEMDKTNGEILYAAAGNLESEAKGIYKSDDAGATWELLTEGLPDYTHDGRITISAYAGNYNKLWAIIGNALSTVGIYYSDNAGNTWTEIDDTEIVSYQGWYAKGLLIKPDDESEILAGGVELFKSTNGGNTFTQITTYTGTDSYVHPDHHDIVVNPLDPDKVYAIHDGGLSRSNDFGETWYPCVDGYVTSQFYIGSISHQTNAVGLGGLQDNFTQRFDGTNDWLAVIGGDGCYNAINFDDDQIQYAAYQYLGILKSYDQGYNFSEGMATGSSSAFLAPFVMADANPEILYAGKNGLTKTLDGGDDWNNTGAANVDGGNPIIAIGIAPSNPDIVYFATAPLSNNADVFVSTDGGETRTNITGLLPDRYPRDIAVNYTNPDEVYIVYAGFGGGHIFNSMNAGADWEDISAALPDIPFHSILIDPLNDSILYAGCDITLFVSFDKGNNWETYNGGLPEAAMVFDIKYSPSDTSLFLFTHGRGVYHAPSLGKDTITDSVDIAISVHDGASVTLYPSFFQSYITIAFSQPPGHAQLNFYAVSGNLIKTVQLHNHKNQRIDCSALPAGSYIAEIVSANKKYVAKLLKL